MPIGAKVEKHPALTPALNDRANRLGAAAVCCRCVVFSSLAEGKENQHWTQECRETFAPRPNP